VSHGGCSSEEIADPDLTAMLDVVMQMLMYFIMCANFIGQENNADVTLPLAQAAKPLNKDEGDVLFINVGKDGKVLILGEEPKDLNATKLWLDNRALDAKQKSGDNTNRTAIVVRADEDVKYEAVYNLMQTCKEKGFKRFKLRAIIDHSEGS
jgi:biopolymer transport protein ExbD